MGTSLAEQYRPRTWDQVIGQPKAVALLQRLEPRGFGGKAYWISGASGTGKTTLAWLIARSIADDWSIQEMDGGALTPSVLKDIQEDLPYRGLGKGGKAYLISEAHGLRRDTIRQLLVLLEHLPGHVAFVFSTTAEGELDLFEDKIDAHPLTSRCVNVSLTNQGLCKAFAARARDIAIAEGLDGKPEKAYEALAKDCRNSMRKMLERIEAGEMLS